MSFFDLDERTVETELEVLQKYELVNLSQGQGSGLGKIHFMQFVRDRPNDFLAGLTVSKIRLRGSRISGQHQELMIDCHSGVRIRISRNNCSDTLQVGADDRALPILEEISPLGLCTGTQVHEVFNAVHARMPRYAHGDCHSFAQAVMTRLSGTAAPSASSGDEDDGFM